MSTERARIDTNIAKTLLELYSEASGYPVALYEGERVIVPDRSGMRFQAFCQKLHELGMKDRCDADHKRRGAGAQEERFEICHAGLFNYTLPISVDKDVVATILCGQTRLTDESSEVISRERRQRVYGDLRLTSEQRTELEKLYRQIPQIDPRSDEIPLLDHLWAIQLQFYEVISLRIKNAHERALLEQSQENIAHEFQIRLQALLADSENLFRSMHLGQALTRRMLQDSGDILKGVQRLSVLVQNLNLGLGDYEWAETDIATVVRETTALYESEAQRKFVLFDIKVQGCSFTMSDKHMAHALNNLVHNAVKYSYRGTEAQSRFIRIRGHRFTANYQLEVENYGLGILPQERSLIFTKGYRGSLTRDESRTGAGLGLAIVREIVGAHGGSIEVRSNPVGTDAYLTCFTVQLPLMRSPGRE
jgi:signal transduction histidine kinase